MSSRSMSLDVLVRLRDKLTGPLRRLRDQLKQLVDFGRRLGVLGAAIAAISFMGPIKEAAAFQQKLLDIAGTIDLNGKKAFDFTEELRASVSALAIAAGQASDTIASGYGQMIAAGLDRGLVDASIGAIARASTAANAEFADMAQVSVSFVRIEAGGGMFGGLASLSALTSAIGAVRSAASGLNRAVNVHTISATRLRAADRSHRVVKSSVAALASPTGSRNIVVRISASLPSASVNPLAFDTMVIAIGEQLSATSPTPAVAPAAEAPTKSMPEPAGLVTVSRSLSSALLTAASSGPSSADKCMLIAAAAHIGEFHHGVAGTFKLQRMATSLWLLAAASAKSLADKTRFPDAFNRRAGLIFHDC